MVNVYREKLGRSISQAVVILAWNIEHFGKLRVRDVAHFVSVIVAEPKTGEGVVFKLEHSEIITLNEVIGFGLGLPLDLSRYSLDGSARGGLRFS